jgi:hypothetical protein
MRVSGLRIDVYDRKAVHPASKTFIGSDLIHMDSDVGRTVGFPVAYDFGVQRVV